MPYKDYSNPLYDTVPNEADWMNGLCCIFANALAERFRLPIKALLVRSKRDGNCTLVHAFGSLPGERIVDARGIAAESSLLSMDYVDFGASDWRAIHCAEPGEEIEVVIEAITVDQLWDLNPEDIEATNAAHEHIEKHAARFAEIERLAASGVAH